jgi:hypothetical protein
MRKWFGYVAAGCAALLIARPPGGAARAFVRFLQSPQAVAVMKAKGLELPQKAGRAGSRADVLHGPALHES